MKRELSGREKGLIYALGCLVAFTLITVFVLLPGLERLQEVKTDRLETEARKTETETIIKNQAANEAALEEIQSQAQDKTASYYSPMDPEEADMLLSGMINRYGFSPTSLSMEPLAEATIEPYSPGGDGSSDSAASQDTSEASSEDTSGDTAENASEDTSDTSEEDGGNRPTLQSYHVTVSGEGTGNQVAGLVGEICLNPSMHLISFDNQINITEENVYDDQGLLTSTNTVTKYVVTVTVEIFTYKPYNPQSQASEDSQSGDTSLGRDFVPEGGSADTPGGDTSNTDPNTENGAANNDDTTSGNGTAGGNNTTNRSGTGSTTNPDNNATQDNNSGGGRNNNTVGGSQV